MSISCTSSPWCATWALTSKRDNFSAPLIVRQFVTIFTPAAFLFVFLLTGRARFTVWTRATVLFSGTCCFFCIEFVTIKTFVTVRSIGRSTFFVVWNTAVADALVGFWFGGHFTGKFRATLACLACSWWNTFFTFINLSSSAVFASYTIGTDTLFSNPCAFSTLW